MRIVIAGPKGSGKSALGSELVDLTHLPIVETDELIESRHQECDGHFLTCREIFTDKAAPRIEVFINIKEHAALKRIAREDLAESMVLVPMVGGIMYQLSNGIAV